MIFDSNFSLPDDYCLYGCTIVSCTINSSESVIDRLYVIEINSFFIFFIFDNHLNCIHMSKYECVIFFRINSKNK